MQRNAKTAFAKENNTQDIHHSLAKKCTAKRSTEKARKKTAEREHPSMVVDENFISFR